MFRSRKLLRLLLCLLPALFFLLPLHARAAALPGAASIASASDAQAFVQTLLTGDAASLERTCAFTPEMKSALDSSGGLASLQVSLKALGTLQDVEEAARFEIPGYTSWHVPCVFALQSLDIVLNINAQGEIAGIVTAAYTGGGSKDSETEAGLIELDLSIPVPAYENGALPGTLTLPEGDGRFPAVILVHGSGPNNRDEAVGTNAPFRDIAAALSKEGIAVYRYDKRTLVYGSEIAEDLSFTLEQETIEDAVSAAVLLAARDEIDPERIFILGHSLGGMALPDIDRALTEAGLQAAGYIFLAAPARSLPELMREQQDFLYSLMPALTPEQQTEKEAFYEELTLLEHPEALPQDQPVLGAYPAYWADLASRDPLSSAAGITAPCLFLQGEEDYQVTMEDFRLWEDAPEGSGSRRFISYPGLNHLFISGRKEEGPSSYAKPQTVDTRVTADIAAFVKDPQA